MSLLGPVWPASLHASIFAVQLFLAVTVAAYRLVSQMRTMSDESVSNERLSRFFSPELAAAIAEMQEAAARFNAEQRAAGRPAIGIHVGIASGPAAAGYIGTDRYVQYAVIGDATNVAARICSAAGPGQVLVSDATRRGHSGHGVAFEDVPAIAAKGKDGPVTVHRVRLATPS
ncbi:MAG: adenylate/guanylate cyclase domain-containing protein [Planctomycetaceae bacterium]